MQVMLRQQLFDYQHDISQVLVLLLQFLDLVHRGYRQGAALGS